MISGKHCFTTEITLGSIITTALVAACSVALYYWMSDALHQTRTMQIENRVAIETLNKEVVSYKAWESGTLQELRDQVDRLHQDVAVLHKEVSKP